LLEGAGSRLIASLRRAVRGVPPSQLTLNRAVRAQSARLFHHFHGQPEISAKFEIVAVGNVPGNASQFGTLLSPRPRSALSEQANPAREKASSALIA
jgi:hypothetical protein